MLTRLDVINVILASTGTAPVTSNDTMHPSYIRANNTLKRISRSVQGQGFWFNKSVRVLNPTIDGEIILPSNTLSVDPEDPNRHLVQRGTKLYDPQKATTVIGTPVTVVFIEEWEVEDLPAHAQTYIEARAVYQYYLDSEGTEPKLSEYKGVAAEAWGKLFAEHLNNLDINHFDGTSFANFARMGPRRLPL